MSIKDLPNKVIHYCWFGGSPLSDLTKRCIESWKKFLPEFEIKEWNENNFDVNQCKFVSQAYKEKKWAFVADYTRFKVLEKFGGLYLDTDMEITADIAKYLEHEFFVGQEDSTLINAAVVWSKEKNNEHITNIVKIYEEKEEFNAVGDLYSESVPQVLSTYFETYGFDDKKDEIQVLDNGNVYVYPMEYFYPLSYDHQHNKFTENSVMIHHFDATWIEPMEKFKTKMKRKNMKWVVYIIDFFVNTKNFISAYINFKDLIIFGFVFLIFSLTTLAFKPLNQNENIFNSTPISLSIIIAFELLFAYVWTHICKKIRTFEVNKLLDDNLLENKKLDYKKSHINDQVLKSIAMYENKIWAIQILLLVVMTILYPISYSLNILKVNEYAFVITFIISVLAMYTGIKKQFKYRILDLLLISISLTLMSVTGLYGIVISIILLLIFGLEIVYAKLSKKRMIVFGLSIITFTTIFHIFNLIFNTFKLNFEKVVNFSNIISLKTIDSIESFKFKSDIITNFQFLNIKLSNVMNLFLNIPFLHTLISTIGVVSIIIINIVIICLIRKNIKYIYIVVPVILNTILNSNYNVMLYSNYLVLTFTVIILMIYIFNKIYKDKKIKIN